MRIIADTNVLVRAITGDDERQSAVAKAELQKAEAIALALPALCELVWVLSRGYKAPSERIADMLRRLIGSANVLADRPAVEAGLAMLEGGGDFAVGVIAHEGGRLGGQVFVSFDKKAVRLLEEQSEAARLLR
jgi:predicted nucleic-acid-binding protein